MPIYTYKNADTGKTVERFYHRADEAPQTIQVGQLTFQRDIAADLAPRRKRNGGVLGNWDSHPVQSIAMAVPPAFQDEVRAREPDAEFTPEGFRVFRNRRQRRKAIKRHGLIDRSAYR